MPPPTQTPPPDARGYCTIAQVENWYGSAITGNVLADANGWMAAAEYAIDGETGYPFLTTADGIIQAERQELCGPRVWTRLRPIASVQAIRGYRRGDTTPTLLALTHDYEIDSIDRGALYVRPWQVWHYFQVDYTVPNVVPAPVSEATALLVARLLAEPGLVVGGAVTSAKFADIAETYATPSGGTAPTGGLPLDVIAVLGPWAGTYRPAFA